MIPASAVTHWQILGPIPSGIRFYNVDCGGHPNLTPVSVRQRYEEEIPEKGLMIWLQDGLFGCKAGGKELATPTQRIEEVRLGYAHPKNGAGYVYLYVQSRGEGENRYLFSADRMEPGLWHWFQQVWQVLQPLFPGKMRELDETQPPSK